MISGAPNALADTGWRYHDRQIESLIVVFSDYFTFCLAKTVFLDALV